MTAFATTLVGAVAELTAISAAWRPYWLEDRDQLRSPNVPRCSAGKISRTVGNSILLGAMRASSLRRAGAVSIDRNPFL